jgi:hypothetical protein
MRILVCGGRDFNNKSLMFETLDKLCKDNDWYYGGDLSGEPNYLPNVFIISGKAKGADTLAIDWAIINFCGFKEYPAQWDKYGPKAGPIRNQQMLDEGKPDLVVAFHGKPREDGRRTGTQDMVSRAKKAGVKVIEVDYER